MYKDLLKAVKQHLGDASLGLSIIEKGDYLRLGKEKTEKLEKIRKDVEKARVNLERW